MDERTYAEIKVRLIRDYAFKASGSDWLRQGKCPTCAKKELYVSATKPWVVRCGRISKCGAEMAVKELYPDLFDDWSKRYVRTPEAPNAAADAYLSNGRGFDLSLIRGWYTQDTYYDHELEIGSATVRFALGAGHWERIIDRPQRFGSKKAMFKPGAKYQGSWWQPPTLPPVPEEVWIVEGIFDAIAMLHAEVPAVAAMSCNNYPSAALQGLSERAVAAGLKRPRLVWALDGDKAGRGYARRWVERSTTEGWTATAAVIAQPVGTVKLDWNDMFQRGQLAETDLKEYRYQGALLLADSPQAKALLMYRHDMYSSFSFNFDNKLFWFKLELEKYSKAMEAAEKEGMDKDAARDRALLECNSVAEIANCYPTALYYQAHELTDESWYYLRVDFPHDGAPVKNTFTGSQLSSATEFKKRLLSIAPGGVYTGSAGQLDALLKLWLGRIKTVATIDFVGYSKDHGAWLFNDVAVKDGRQVAINDEDYFELSRRLSVKSLNQSVHLAINTDEREFSTAWLSLLWKCFGAKGLVCLAFWLGSFFAEQIRAQHKSYPFLEVVGEPGSGKTTIIEFLWKLAGRRDYEGFDPVKSTQAGRARNMAQVGNLPVVLIEGDRGGEDTVKQKGFDWDEIKTLYNGRSVRSRGVKNGGNETFEPPFRGAVVISQNATVQASDAVLQRICHLDFHLAEHTQATKKAAEELERTELESGSGFILRAVMAEKKIMETVATQTPVHERALSRIDSLRNLRVMKNHAQIMALVDALPAVVPIDEERLEAARKLLADLAVERQQAINSDHPLVQEFWEVYDYLEGDSDEPRLNHSHDHDTGEIAINLNHFAAVCSDRRQQIPILSDLKRVLRTSRTRKFIEIRTVNSRPNAIFNRDINRSGPARPSSLKCWIFQAAK